MSDLPDSETPLPGDLPGLIGDLDAGTPDATAAMPDDTEGAPDDPADPADDPLPDAEVGDDRTTRVAPEPAVADMAAAADADAAAEATVEALSDEPGEAPASPASAPRPAPDKAAPRPSSTHVRAFLAINFPVGTVRRIADEAASLRGPVTAAGLSVKWVPGANLHLTLKFLGPVRVVAVEAIVARIGSGLAALGPAGARPFELEVRGLGAFPSAERPRILWAGVSPSSALAALHNEVEGWMADLGFPRDERPFHPHVTLGRVTSGNGDLSSLIAERGDKGLGGGRVTEIVLYESRTLHKGSEYHALARMPLIKT